MARPKKPVPEMKFHSPTGYFYCLYDGNRKYFTKDESTSVPLYQAYLTEVLAHIDRTRADAASEVRTTASPVPGTFTVAQVLDRFDRIEGPKLPAWKRSRVDCLMVPTLAEIGAVRADRFDFRCLARLKKRLIATVSERTGRKLSRTYLNHLLGELALVWRWAVLESLAPQSTLGAFELSGPIAAGQGAVELDPVPPVDVPVVLATLPGLPGAVRAMVLVQMLSEMRPGEVIRLTPGQLLRDPDAKQQIPGTRQKTGAVRTESGQLVWVSIFHSHKTAGKGKARIVCYGPQCQSILSPLMVDLPADGPIFRSARASSTRRKSWAGYTLSGYEQAVRRALLKINKTRASTAPPLPPLEYWSPGQLRHTAATEVAEAFDRSTAAAFLGHSGLDSIDVYATQSLGKAAEAAAKMG